MKKSIIILVTIVFMTVTTGTAFARRGGYDYQPYHHGHHSSSGDFWAVLGFGLLTGSLLSYAFYPPPSSTVVYSSPEPIVVERPARVVVREYAYVPPPQVAGDKVVVTAQELNVRGGPGLNHPIAGYVVLGESLEVISRVPGWVYVKAASGLQGWVMVNFTAPQASPMG